MQKETNRYIKPRERAGRRLQSVVSVLALLTLTTPTVVHDESAMPSASAHKVTVPSVPWADQMLFSPVAVIAQHDEPQTKPVDTAFRRSMDAVEVVASGPFEQGASYEGEPTLCDSIENQFGPLCSPPLMERPAIIIDDPPPSDPAYESASEVRQNADSVYYDDTLAPEQKWALAQELVARACPSGSLLSGSYALRPQMGEDTDGMLGYVDIEAQIVSVDVRPQQRALDVAITQVHELTHERDVRGLIDHTRWLQVTGDAEGMDDGRWYFGSSGTMGPGEVLARLTPAALFGMAAARESLFHSGNPLYSPSLSILEGASEQAVAVAGQLTGCFS